MSLESERMKERRIRRQGRSLLECPSNVLETAIDYLFVDNKIDLEMVEGLVDSIGEAVYWRNICFKKHETTSCTLDEVYERLTRSEPSRKRKKSGERHIAAPIEYVSKIEISAECNFTKFLEGSEGDALELIAKKAVNLRKLTFNNVALSNRFQCRKLSPKLRSFKISNCLIVDMGTNTGSAGKFFKMDPKIPLFKYVRELEIRLVECIGICRELEPIVKKIEKLRCLRIDMGLYMPFTKYDDTPEDTLALIDNTCHNSLTDLHLKVSFSPVTPAATLESFRSEILGAICLAQPCLKKLTLIGQEVEHLSDENIQDFAMVAEDTSLSDTLTVLNLGFTESFTNKAVECLYANFSVLNQLYVSPGSKLITYTNYGNIMSRILQVKKEYYDIGLE